MNNEMISGLIGAIVGGLFTLWGTLIEGKRQERNNEADSKEKKKNVLIGVKTEITTLLELYQSRMMNHMGEYNGDAPFNLIFPITQNNFSFYESNAFYLSSTNEITLKAIVAFYSSARSLVDSFKYNNLIIEDLIKKNTLYHESQLEIHLQDLRDTIAMATDYGKGLKSIHSDTMIKLDVCICKINEEILELESKPLRTLGYKVSRILAFRR
ncbi:hypothetical protein SAMN05428971_0222 [Candidatus Pantoea varia]|uniref:Uncharacterized protein n=1 Tax=Candidatus Pantoea varia TaxID=1881036 RepID=A0A1I4WLI0_9GAMM|nr:hypothetical protein [Pantoea varia]SFN14073.1 hypothetical protein SAMN05428971_0222 [Pantoea varia]